MPLTPFQIETLFLLKQNRSPDSYIAGGAAINRSAHSPRFSRDVDFFHDVDEAVSLSAAEDLKVLHQAGYSIETLLNQPSFIRVIARKSSDAVKLEWVRDTAFRFFPILEDPLLGFRLHDADLMVNKCLALANREEVRDVIDLLELENNVTSLAAAIWAACGKDPGFSPDMMIDYMKRHSRIDSVQLASEATEPPIVAHELKAKWLNALEQASIEIRQFPAAQIGCLYLDTSQEIALRPSLLKETMRILHFGTLRGSWPRIVR
jgi:hypothetical protein